MNKIYHKMINEIASKMNLSKEQRKELGSIVIKCIKYRELYGGFSKESIDQGVVSSDITEQELDEKCMLSAFKKLLNDGLIEKELLEDNGERKVWRYSLTAIPAKGNGND